jgi:hypothetical protein
VSYFIYQYAYDEWYYAKCHIIMPSVLYAECHYAECRYAECRYAECRYAECHYAECRYAECRGAELRTMAGIHKTHYNNLTIILKVRGCFIYFKLP